MEYVTVTGPVYFILALKQAAVEKKIRDVLWLKIKLWNINKILIIKPIVFFFFLFDTAHMLV